MTQQQRIIISVVAAVLLIGAALFFSTRDTEVTPSETSSSTPTTVTPSERTFTKAELAAGNGIDKNPCYVAVDGTVYEISNSILWVMGVHTPTKGLIKCGEDHSQTILNSPHGKSKLKYLDTVGKLVE
jgi:predicted heme/steroid binding protein